MLVSTHFQRLVRVGPENLLGELAVPLDSQGLVVLADAVTTHAHRNLALALNVEGFTTVVLNLRTAEERQVGTELPRELERLSARLLQALEEIAVARATRGAPAGLFGMSPALLVAAAERPERVGAVVSCDGAPWVAGEALARVEAPTLLLVQDGESARIQRHLEASRSLRRHHVTILPWDPRPWARPADPIAEVLDHACGWFEQTLLPARPRRKARTAAEWPSWPLSLA